MQRYESKTFISNSLLQRFDGNVNEHSYPVMNFPVDITCKHRRVNPVSVGKLKINAAGEALFFCLFFPLLSAYENHRKLESNLQ